MDLPEGGEGTGRWATVLVAAVVNGFLVGQMLADRGGAAGPGAPEVHRIQGDGLVFTYQVVATPEVLNYISSCT